MPLSDRDYMKEPHLPSCTCVDCVNRRLGIVTERKNKKDFKKKPPYYKKYRRRSIHLDRMGKSIWSKIKRLLIIISLLAVTTITLVTVCKFISNELETTSFIIYLVVDIIVLIGCLVSVSKKWLSFTRTFLVVIFVGILSLISYVYLDIRSFQDVKESVENALSTKTEDFRNRIDLAIKRVELKLINIDEAVEEEVEEVNEITDTKNVIVDGAILIGADGHYITLKNNLNAKNPSWEELKSFLLNDKTDLIEYDFDKFVCADFAEMVHNNAEEAGIRAAFVSIWLGPCSYYPMSGGHALNAFETTDKGLVFIDCTGFFSSMNADKIVDLQLGEEYIPISIFPQPGWSDIWDSMGKVEDIEIIQW